MWTHVQLLPRVTSLILQATPHWKYKWTTHSPILVIYGGALKSKVVFLPDEVGSDLPVTMWYFENSFGVVCKVPPRSSSHEGLCLFCCPQRKYTDCRSHVYKEITSADWFYEAFNNSTIHLTLKVECSGSSPGVYLLVSDTLTIPHILTVWWRSPSILSYKLY